MTRLKKAIMGNFNYKYKKDEEVNPYLADNESTLDTINFIVNKTKIDFEDVRNVLAAYFEYYITKVYELE